MLKMGIQRQAIGQKMVTDEIPANVIAIFTAGPNGDEAGGARVGDTGGAGAGQGGREWKKGGGNSSQETTF